MLFAKDSLELFRIYFEFWPGTNILNKCVGIWCGYTGRPLIICMFHNYACEMAPDHGFGEGLIGRYFGLTQTSGPRQTHKINLLGVGVGTMVGC